MGPPAFVAAIADAAQCGSHPTQQQGATSPHITLEMGELLSEALDEVEKCAWNFDFYAESEPAFLQDQVVASAALDSRIVYDPTFEAFTMGNSCCQAVDQQAGKQSHIKGSFDDGQRVATDGLQNS